MIRQLLTCFVTDLKSDFASTKKVPVGASTTKLCAGTWSEMKILFDLTRESIGPSPLNILYNVMFTEMKTRDTKLGMHFPSFSFSDFMKITSKRQSIPLAHFSPMFYFYTPITKD